MSFLEKKIYDGERISEQEALSLFAWDLPDLAKAGDARRKIAFPKEDVGFVIDRIVNFTNVCEARCRFCAFHARADRIAPYAMADDEILEKVKALEEAGGSQVMLQGGLSPDCGLDDFIRMVKMVREKFPNIYIHSFSPAELDYVSRKSGLPLEEVVKALKQAGLDSVPGASDILVDRVRKIACPNKISVDGWRRAIRVLAENDMKSSATMTYGMGETLEERIEHLSVIRSTQDECGNLRAFIPWSFSPANTRMSDLPPSTGIAYLKIVSVGRIFLDNIVHIQAGWLTEGMPLAQIALSAGANDMGGVLMEEVVVKATGIETRTNVEQMVHVIRNAGKTAVLRDSAYNEVKRFA